LYTKRQLVEGVFWRAHQVEARVRVIAGGPLSFQGLQGRFGQVKVGHAVLYENPGI
jgi:hypothetical protein